MFYKWFKTILAQVVPSFRKSLYTVTQNKQKHKSATTISSTQFLKVLVFSRFKINRINQTPILIREALFKGS